MLERVVRGVMPWAAIAVLGGLAIVEMRGEGGPKVGRPAPALRLALDDGSQFDLAAQVGQVVVVNFWGTYCPPCRAEAPVLARAWQQLRRTDDVLLGVAVDRAPLADVTRFARGLGMPYPIAIADVDLVADYRVTTVPTTVVIDPRGKVARTLVGQVDDASLSEAIDLARRR
jgi:peroxiredoxin